MVRHMSEKLRWILKPDFLDKELWAPYHINRDIDYYDDLCKKYRIMYNNAKIAGADKGSLEIIKGYSDKLKKAIRNYYMGKISTSHIMIKNLIKEVINNPLAVETVYKSKAFPGISREIQFYRARTSDRVTTFKAKEMLHIPFDLRGKTGNYRFSIPGIPSLYLGNTTYSCWIELGCLPEYMFNVSPVLLDGTQRILNLAVMTRKQWTLHDCDKDYVHCWLKLIILMIATSYVIDEPERIFKSEYIVSQSIMLGCKELGLDGVAYYSKRVHDEAFANAAICVALFSVYRKNQKYSSICKHIKIDDSYNFSMYKQLGIEDRTPEYADYRMQQTGEIANIGTYAKQFSYTNTEFCSFDKFLFKSWKNKEKISFGNALNCAINNGVAIKKKREINL